MDEDTDEKFAEHDDVMIQRNKAGTRSSKLVEAGHSTKKRKLASDDIHSGSGVDLDEPDVEPDDSGSGGDLDDSVEPDDSQDDVTNLQAFASDLRIDDTENHGRGAGTRKNKLSVKKTGANTRDREYTDSRVKRGTKNMGTRLLTRVSDNDPEMPVIATKLQDAATRKNMMEDWDLIESLSNSNSGDSFHFESKSADVKRASDQQKPVDTETPKRACKMIPSDADKKKQTPVRQLVKSGSTPRKDMKYCEQNDLLEASEEIAVEEDESDVAEEDFLSVDSGSSAARSVKGYTRTKTVTSSFWLTSPESRKSVYNTDDEFVSNLVSYKHLHVVVTWFRVRRSHFQMYYYYYNHLTASFPGQLG